MAEEDRKLARGSDDAERRKVYENLNRILSVIVEENRLARGRAEAIRDRDDAVKRRKEVEERQKMVDGKHPWIPLRTGQSPSANFSNP